MEKHLRFVQKQLIYHSEVFLIWPYPDQPMAHKASPRKRWRDWVWLPTPGYILPKVWHWKFSFLGFYAKIFTKLIDTLQKYWWSKNPGMWLIGKLFWSINKKPMHVTILISWKLISLSFSTTFHLALATRPGL